MLTYILEIIFFLSAGVVLYLIIQKLPILEGMGTEEGSRKGIGRVQEKITRLADEKFLLSSMKFLRRLRVIIMKFDNAVSRNLDRMKLKAEEQQDDGRVNILKDADEKKQEESDKNSVE